MEKKKEVLEKEALLLGYSFEWGVDFTHRVIRISGDVEEGMFDFLDAALTKMESESRKTITIRLNSFGGDMYESFAMAGRIRSSKCRVITEAYGKVMSAGFLVFMSGMKRRMSKYSWAMHHEMNYGTYDRHTMNHEMVVQCEKELKQMCTMLEEFSGIPAMFWFEESKLTDKYYSAKDCLDMGMIDEVI